MNVTSIVRLPRLGAGAHSQATGISGSFQCNVGAEEFAASYFVNTLHFSPSRWPIILS
jgi:hypothetical protein